MTDQTSESMKKHLIISRDLREKIRLGLLPPGSRLAAERELADAYGVSRPTVGRALNDLVAGGLVERRVGSGSFVTFGSSSEKQLTFGLIVPGLGRGEILEPICARIAEWAAAEDYSLNWGGSRTEGESLATLLKTLEGHVTRRVDGIFFQPIELESTHTEMNRKMIRHLKESQIPVVLLDADYLPFPERGDFDIVGIDNIRAAWVATDHLLSQGKSRIDFVTRPFTATTADRRIHGYRLSLLTAGISPEKHWIHSIDPENHEEVTAMLKSGARDLVCVNDETAAILMLSLEELGIAVPDDVRITGFDDLKYARLVRVPLTTMRQPCDSIGDAAIDAMLSRLERPHQAPREILIEAEFMIRASSISK
ncbi:hypothetical protein S1OALGB6SA_661 [Olavius algarvensis spirochete endosymbiont]|uniref:LacI family DNA-binding transcriptional regulator n=1 Tax=Olavius algarvensis spirochete endosymbiont TaxID=260710 RepID=UPI000F2354C7|nr:GntR family transcriptional regulator [Olavius algarvensis spirochete endosymbiont]VDA99590.1 hypothetical protein S1OALGB6SA_661 [Olavius algarvensis spirochete endosymbiont]